MHILGIHVGRSKRLRELKREVAELTNDVRKYQMMIPPCPECGDRNMVEFYEEVRTKSGQITWVRNTNEHHFICTNEKCKVHGIHIFVWKELSAKEVV